jgi:hypothetical protein
MARQSGFVSVGLGVSEVGSNFESAGGGSTPPGAISTCLSGEGPRGGLLSRDPHLMRNETTLDLLTVFPESVAVTFTGTLSSFPFAAFGISIETRSTPALIDAV